jgi:O-acetylhomoserine/O-acetylserine sulfhydrylase-like pyridoxal-dependent enzyme
MEVNQGTVVTFLVISAAIEWIEQHHISKKERHERKIREEKEAAEAILTKKLVGTKVTVENFMAWKMEFDCV